MKKTAKSTYEKFIEDDDQRELLDKEYKELLLSELLIAAMEHDHLSVRKLASAAGVSPTIIQGLRSGTKTNITIDTLSKILDAVGYQIIFTPKIETHPLSSGSSSRITGSTSTTEGNHARPRL
jgi:transcriptional regulator with XRE-family HTH domain